MSCSLSSKKGVSLSFASHYVFFGCLFLIFSSFIAIHLGVMFKHEFPHLNLSQVELMLPEGLYATPHPILGPNPSPFPLGQLT